MPTIQPNSDLRNKANEISDVVHKTSEPVLITRKGEGDMVVMSMARYGQLERRLELYSKLAVAKSRAAAGDKGRSLGEVMKGIRKQIRESA